MQNLLNFPATTLVGIPVPKSKFWARAERKSEAKDFLTREFESITWLYKLAPSTLNVADGESVHEIDVFCFKVKSERLNPGPWDASAVAPQLMRLDCLIPRPTVYIIERDGMFDLLLQHKEMANGKWRTGDTERLEWPVASGQWAEDSGQGAVPCPLRIEGHTMDAVYIALLSQVSGLEAHSADEYKAQAEIRRRTAALEKQIAALEKQMAATKQPRRKRELFEQIRALKPLIPAS